ncbi:hypothetical protein HAX54_025693 [Datura stramonium]|uniref:Uncharacterized protein n=1 Tax=Datura stramonium TaxID=4076 RepID=A0ABS8V2J5_DATST|nr:hypothetical protein [Datura stramonium]
MGTISKNDVSNKISTVKAFPAFAATSIAFYADPTPALPNLNEIPVGLSQFFLLKLPNCIGRPKRMPPVWQALAKNLWAGKRFVRQAGAQDELTLEKLVDAVKYHADVDKLPVEERIPTPIDFRAQINKKDLV